MLVEAFEKIEKQVEEYINKLRMTPDTVATKVVLDTAAAQAQLVGFEAMLARPISKRVNILMGGTDEPVMRDVGGYTADGPKYEPRGIVHAGEFVVRSEVLKQQGVLSLLDRLNRYGAAALPGFADGGLVGRLAIPSLRSPQPVTERMAATFNFPGLGSYRASLSADTFAQLQRDFQRAALQKGGRA